MKRKAILAFSVWFAACGGTLACGSDGAADPDGDEEDAGGASDDDASDDDAADDDAADDDAADDDVADDDAADDDAADDDVADDDAADDDAADDDSGDDDVDGGADDDVGDDDVDGGADDDVEEGDGGTPEGDGGSDPAGGTTRSGFVTIGQSVLSVAGTEIVTGFGAAGFTVTETTTDGEVVTPDCETTTVDACTLVSCVVTDGGGGGGTSTSTNVSAGDVTVAGASEEIVMTPDEEATYSTYSGMTALWEGGEALTASAPGTDDVPAFEVEITAPSAVTLTEPVIDLLTPISASRSEPFDVAWSDGEEGLVMVSLIDTTEGAEITHTIQCALPTSSGGTSISEELLVDFGDSAALSVVIQASGVATVEDWNISFTASQSLATGQVEFTE